MNFKTLLSLFITLAIALQSVGAMAASTQIHQIDIEHLQIEHVHDQQVSTLTEQYDQSGHNVKDCHHCGHCSGSHLSWFVSKPITALYIKQSRNIMDNECTQALHRHEPQYKPPRA
ncbi:DUF2946 domain-containing protein [Pseudoalteromonas sp. S16_S37]|uniref:DUF2946 domain-containing protein n=1 Tax=Pseudoalteromonas sp. S16_S37 TaxID=2720228 RepID=UPI0016811408|nr:DUF2946 domain-containing protein [Pseudoalteromonas sp. S16_S37]MBD1583776.1 DUF2946 domain-containing protein [Pseudoalteromonas sp. S16_S37]